MLRTCAAPICGMNTNSLIQLDLIPGVALLASLPQTVAATRDHKSALKKAMHMDWRNIMSITSDPIRLLKYAMGFCLLTGLLWRLFFQLACWLFGPVS
jgi:hypothetical protein